MPSPFPGMDPYLENPELWTAVHASLIARFQEQLAPAVRPHYIVRSEERVYVTDEDDPGFHRRIPDVRLVGVDARRSRGSLPGATVSVATATIAEPIPVIDTFTEFAHELRLEIRDPADRSVITVIELLSPANKIPGSIGRESFIQKRREVYASTTHWIEIDLLRSGAPTAHRSPAPGTEYHAFLSKHEVGRGNRHGFVWQMPLRERLPTIGIPLRDGEPRVPLDLQAALDRTYELGSYDLDFTYAEDPPLPKMSADTLAWCRSIIAAHQSSSGSTT